MTWAYDPHWAYDHEKLVQLFTEAGFSRGFQHTSSAFWQVSPDVSAGRYGYWQSFVWIGSSRSVKK